MVTYLPPFDGPSRPPRDGRESRFVMIPYVLHRISSTDTSVHKVWSVKSGVWSYLFVNTFR